ncbi:ferritin-like domain-containing protein [Lederbergia wuyishanensis]|uniref:Rubrerythrin n=1 Tax=Lederbergia wuyishanensis TaxID=1347903 RepID=A0ABU0D9X0_9BACI|nr:ferritin-like domain-containing protein [Lederbergia wuyishanensis]MCJ8008485.1 ferritin-like domain-containing protein [Lederbergia wuyishanensis]MDQ0345228.1 rubrerythrin [Lederbergia wuyishanensis]
MSHFHEDKSLIEKVATAIYGEYTAIHCYAKLINMAPTEKEKERINEIRNDEIRHFNTFCAIYTLLTNKQPQPHLGNCPDQYVDLLEFAFEDEQHTVDFYLDIAEDARDPFIRERFRSAAADEQNHAVWFLSFLQKHMK